MRAYCQAIDNKEALIGRQPNFYLSNFIFYFIVLLCFIRFMIMWSHKINTVKTKSKTAEEKAHPGGSAYWRLNANKEHLADV